MSDNDYLEILAASLAEEIVRRLYRKSEACDCHECCPKPPPQQPASPDCADLIFSVLGTNGLNRLKLAPVRPPSNTVTIFKGQYAGRFGVVYQGQFSPCSCCVFVLTPSGVVKVSRKHCNIHQ